MSNAKIFCDVKRGLSTQKYNIFNSTSFYILCLNCMFFLKSKQAENILMMWAIILSGILLHLWFIATIKCKCYLAERERERERSRTDIFCLHDWKFLVKAQRGAKWHVLSQNLHMLLCKNKGKNLNIVKLITTNNFSQTIVI